jgi:hypothetical protein
MAYSSRISAEADYLHAMGRAFCDFTYVESRVVWSIVNLGANGFGAGARPLNTSSGVTMQRLVR